MTRPALVLALLIVAVGCSHSSSDDSGSGSGDPGVTDQPSGPSCNYQMPKQFHQRIQAHGWRRHIMVEPQPHRRSLLLVIDEADGDSKTLRQQVRLRKSFKDPGQLHRAIAEYQTQHLDTELTPLTVTNNPIWPIDHQWTQDDEADYAQWIQANASDTILSGGGINVDCADFAITLRWLYAREHHLPAGNSLAASGHVWGSWESTTAWDGLPTAADWKSDERFKAALRYVLDSAYTHTIINDLYPVTVQPQFVAPGTIFLTLWDQVTGHTRTITNIGPGPDCPDSGPCIAIIFGDEPASEAGYSSAFVPYRVDQGTGGFLRWRWPEQDSQGAWSLRPAPAMPGYSTEQFTWTDTEYDTNVDSRLNLWSSPEQKYVSIGRTLMTSLQQRLQITEQGYYLCSLVPCAANDANYNTWSTPVRDSNLVSQIQVFKATQANPNDPDVQSFRGDANSSIYLGGASFLNVLTSSVAQSFDANPQHSFFARWGQTDPADADARLKGLAQVAFDNYMARVDQVYGNADTTRLDQAFRTAQQNFLADFQNSSAAVQADVTATLQSQATGLPFCQNSGCGTTAGCTMYDLMVADPSHIQNMTSDPSDSQAARFGF